MVQCSRIYSSYPRCDFDVELASYLVDPSGSKHDLESTALRYLHAPLAVGPSGQMDLLQDEEALAGQDMRYAEAVGEMVQPMEAEMNVRGLRPLFEDVEMPLQEVLAEMEIRGIRLDTAILATMQEELEGELSGLEEKAYELAGERFNLNSPQQLSRILFEVLELPPVKRTKTGFATDISVLSALADLHPIAAVLVRYRELSKLLNTYVCALPRLVDPATGRLHACFNQAVTATGRLSSSNPNLQNIPVRTELGKTIRKAFLPTSPDGLILSADYSQIELRVMAHLSGDESLRRAFAEDRDIHASTASEVFDVPFDEVTAEQRRQRQGHQLRHHLRHQPLRPLRTAGHRPGGGRELHIGILPRVPRGERVPGPPGGGGHQERLRHDHPGSPPRDPRAGGGQRAPAPPGRTAGLQHPHTGQRGRYHQGGHAAHPPPLQGRGSTLRA